MACSTVQARDVATNIDGQGPSIELSSPITGSNVHATGGRDSTANNYSQITSNAIAEECRQNERIDPPKIEDNQTKDDEDADPVTGKVYLKIVGLALTASAPLIVLISIFIGILNSNTVHRTNQDVLVRFEATRLLIPLQIAALVASFTIGILMKLRAYQIARMYAQQEGFIAMSRQFPSPNARVVEYLFFPSISTTLQAVSYALTPVRGSKLHGFKTVRFFVKNGRSRMMPILSSVTVTLVFSTFLCLCFAALVTVIQGVAAVENFEQVTTVLENRDLSGRELPPICGESQTSPVNGIEYTCSLKFDLGGWLQSAPAETDRALNNESSLNSILWDSQNNVAFLAPPIVNRFTDFTATTLGIHTNCSPRNKACRLQSRNTTVYQRCPLLEFMDFNGNRTSSLDVSRSTAVAINYTGRGEANPFNYWIWAMYQSDPNSSLLDDDEVLHLGNVFSILLDCEVSIFNYTYSFINGTLKPNERTPSGFSAPLNATLVSKEAAQVFSDPLSLTFGMRLINERLRGHTAVFSTATAVAEAAGRTVSENALAIGAGVFVKTEALAQSAREDIQVTKLPIALVVLCCLVGYLIVIESLGLAVLAVLDVRVEGRLISEYDKMRLQSLVARMM